MTGFEGKVIRVYQDGCDVFMSMENFTFMEKFPSKPGRLPDAKLNALNNALQETALTIVPQAWVTQMEKIEMISEIILPKDGLSSKTAFEKALEDSASTQVNPDNTVKFARAFARFSGLEYSEDFQKTVQDTLNALKFVIVDGEWAYKVQQLPEIMSRAVKLELELENRLG